VNLCRDLVLGDDDIPGGVEWKKLVSPSACNCNAESSMGGKWHEGKMSGYQMRWEPAAR
jgi:hypothetical protein